jgi:hypothetical protein
MSEYDDYWAGIRNNHALWSRLTSAANAVQFFRAHSHRRYIVATY